MVINVGELKEFQDAIVDLMHCAGVPEKWIKLTSAAYLAKIACDEKNLNDITISTFVGHENNDEYDASKSTSNPLD